MEQEVKVRVIHMAKKSMNPTSILKTLKEEFPSVCTRKLVEWIDDLIEN